MPVAPPLELKHLQTLTHQIRLSFTLTFNCNHTFKDRHSIDLIDVTTQYMFIEQLNREYKYTYTFTKAVFFKSAADSGL